MKIKDPHVAHVHPRYPGRGHTNHSCHSPCDFRPFSVSVATNIFSDLIRYFKLKYSAYRSGFSVIMSRRDPVFGHVPVSPGKCWFPVVQRTEFLGYFCTLSSRPIRPNLTTAYYSISITEDIEVIRS